MEIILVGLNHKTASVDIRERLAFDSQAVDVALKQLKEKFPHTEFVVLSTCNRVEIYCATETENRPDAEALINFLADFRCVPADDFREFLYISHDDEAVRHLLTVTASLDSMVVGEPQITAQVKDSYRLAGQAKTAGKVLSRLFHVAFATTKEIYTGTSIANRRVSVAGVAVDLAKQFFEDITTAKVLVIGAGEMGELLAEHFVHIKCENITVINRTFQRGHALAERHDITARPWEDLDRMLLEANIVVAAATAIEDYLFSKSMFTDVMKQRRGKTLLVIDISVPRNFDPAINDIENVYLYSVDDLAQVVEQNIKLREEDVDRAIEIICQQSEEFMVWLATKDIGPLIGKVKLRFDQIRKNEMEKFFTGDRHDARCKQMLEQTVSRVVNKLLHCVIKNIDIIAKERSPDEAAQLAAGIAEHAEEIASENSDTEKE